MIWRDDRQGDADAFIVGEEKELVPANRPAHADAEFIDGRTGLVGDVARRVVRVEEVVFRIEQRAVPYFVHIAMKCVRAGLGEVVDLGHGVPALVDGEGVCVHGRFLHGIEADDEIGRKPDVQSQPGIVRSRSRRECSRWMSRAGR